MKSTSTQCALLDNLGVPNVSNSSTHKEIDIELTSPLQLRDIVVVDIIIVVILCLLYMLQFLKMLLLSQLLLLLHCIISYLHLIVLCSQILHSLLSYLQSIVTLQAILYLPLSGSYCFCMVYYRLILWHLHVGLLYLIHVCVIYD